MPNIVLIQLMKYVGKIIDAKDDLAFETTSSPRPYVSPEENFVSFSSGETYGRGDEVAFETIMYIFDITL